MASFSTLATLTNEAIQEFAVLYGEFLKVEDIQGAPTVNELKYWLLMKLERGDFAAEDKNNDAHKAEDKVEGKRPEQHPQPQQQSVDGSIPPPPSSNLKKANTLKTTRIEISDQDSDKVHKLDLPFLPNCVDYSETCQALQLNGNLLAPCLTKKNKKFGDLCASCSKKNAPLGRICDRLKFPIGHYVVEAESGKTKKSQKKEEITFGTYIAKRGLTRQQVEEKINIVFSGDIVIPEEQWVVDEKKAAKKVSARGSESGSSDGDSVASSKKNKNAAEEVDGQNDVQQQPEIDEPLSDVEDVVEDSEIVDDQELKEVVEDGDFVDDHEQEDVVEDGEIVDEHDPEDVVEDGNADDTNAHVVVEKVEVITEETKVEEEEKKTSKKTNKKVNKNPKVNKKSKVNKKTKIPTSPSSQLEEEEPVKDESSL